MGKCLCQMLLRDRIIWEIKTSTGWSSTMSIPTRLSNIVRSSGTIWGQMWVEQWGRKPDWGG